MDDYCKIKVGKQVTGIIGLKAAMAEVAAQGRDLSDERIGTLIRERLARKNYMSPGAADLYEQAFLRAYKKHVGEPFDEGSSGVLTIKVLGLGCPRCEQMHRDVMHVLAQNEMAADLEYSTDPLEIARSGAMAPPVLIINGKVMSSGTIPSKIRLEGWILESNRNALP